MVQATVYLADIADFAAMNEVYAEFFEAPYPARAAFQVAALPKNAKVEICGHGGARNKSAVFVIKAS